MQRVEVDVAEDDWDIFIGFRRESLAINQVVLCVSLIAKKTGSTQLVQ